MKTAAAIILGLLSFAIPDQAAPTLPEKDRIRIAEAFRLAEALGNKVWPGWDKAPFAVLLVASEYEFLIRHPKPPKEFTLIGEDPVLKEKVWFRRRFFSTRLLATFPAFDETSTIVIGQPENTESNTSSEWVITFLHEHFHQLQNIQPGYYAGVSALGLARGDQTGMWMLNYPFPYTRPEIKEQFSTLAKSLREALKANIAEFSTKFASYVEGRKKFRNLLSEDDRKYLDFQLWQEGIARYTECRLAELAAAEYTPSKAFQDLKDYKPFAEIARRKMSSIERELGSVRLDRAKREVVYNFGAAEGLVLDRARPGWRKRYFEEKFSLDQYFAEKK